MTRIARLKRCHIKVFLRVFNDWQGYCGAIPWLAEMERQLFRKWTYKSFQDALAELTGESWIDLRGNGYFERDSIIGALVKGAGMSQESASKWFDQAESSYRINIDEFVRCPRLCLASMTGYPSWLMRWVSILAIIRI